MSLKKGDYEAIRDISKQIYDEHSFYVMKGDFLDLFYSNEHLREELIRDEPVERRDLPGWMLAFLAAMVHKLCNDYDLKIPPWVWKDRYYLAEPRFSHDARGKMKAWLFVNAASEFKHRNLFVIADTLDRA